MTTHLSIITATCRRPSHLLNCIEQVHQQSTGDLQIEHIIVSDGPDPVAARIAKQSGATYHEIPRQLGREGAHCRDAGIQLAQGQYIAFWDDDNVYHQHAAATQYASAAGSDISIARCRHRLRVNPGFVTIPRAWTGTPIPGDIDTMCLCVRTELAKQEQWADDSETYGVDHLWVSKLMQHNPSVHYTPIVIGIHA
jgi:glycosyltransferase involved in cell wall biosynthesis